MLARGVNKPAVDVWRRRKTAGMGSTHTRRQGLVTDVQSFLPRQMGKLGMKD